MNEAKEEAYMDLFLRLWSYQNSETEPEYEDCSRCHQLIYVTSEGEAYHLVEHDVHKEKAENDGVPYVPSLWRGCRAASFEANGWNDVIPKHWKATTGPVRASLTVVEA